MSMDDATILTELRGIRLDVQAIGDTLHKKVNEARVDIVKLQAAFDRMPCPEQAQRLTKLEGRVSRIERRQRRWMIGYAVVVAGGVAAWEWVKEAIKTGHRPW